MAVNFKRMCEKDFDVAVVGAGPGGYVAALRCAQWGLKTALIERRELGGTCLNEGCIPAKSLLHSTGLFKEILTRGAANGIVCAGAPVMDVAALQARKNAVVQKLRGGVQTLLDKRGVERFAGEAVLEAAHCVRVQMAEGEPILVRAKHVVWATGAKAAQLPFLPFDGETILSSREAMALERVPASLAVVGAGAIGLEIASVWARLGSKVTVVEALPQVAPGFDLDVAQMAERLIKRLGGFSIETNARVKGFADGVLAYEKNGKGFQVAAEKVLVAVGRVPQTDGLAEAGVMLDEKKRIVVDANFRANVEGFYAIGDTVAGPMLAHRAEAEGEAVARHIAQKAVPHATAVPAVVYTTPELACVGLTQTQAEAQGVEVKISKFPFAANGRALANDATEGFVKLVGDANTKKLLGAQIFGAGAGELIATVAAHLAHGASVADVAHTMNAHPTLSEAIKEAALAWEGEPLHTL